LKSERCGLKNVRVAKTPQSPPGVARSRDEQSDATAWNMVMVPNPGLAANEGDENIDGKDNEGSPDKPLANGVQMPGQGQMQKDDGGAEDSYRQSMPKGIEQSKLHPFLPGTLHAGNVGDGSQMIVVKSMAQAKEQAGDQCKF
jgi:hypothetical protein